MERDVAGGVFGELGGGEQALGEDQHRNQGFGEQGSLGEGC